MPRSIDADASDTTTTTVRMPNELRTSLAREAAKSKRTLSAEIIQRLETSLEAGDLGARVQQLRNEVAHGAHARDRSEAYVKGKESPLEASLLMLFAQLTPERQLALLTLLKA